MLCIMIGENRRVYSINLQVPLEVSFQQPIVMTMYIVKSEKVKKHVIRLDIVKLKTLQCNAL